MIKKRDRSLFLYNCDLFFKKEIGSILIESGKITKMFKKGEIIKNIPHNIKKIDISNRVVFPAFIDSHIHLYLYALSLIEIDFLSCKTIDQVIETIVDYKKKYKKIPKILKGKGLQTKYLSKKILNKKFLDRYFPNSAIIINSRDYHTILTNSKGLEVGLISKNSSIPNGGYLGFDQNGELDGYIYEKGWKFFENIDYPPKNLDIFNLLDSAIKKLYSYGIGSVVDMGYNYNGNRVVREYWIDKKPNLNLVQYIDGDILKKIYPLPSEKIENFQYGGVKIFADGTLSSKTAAIFENYENSDNNRGFFITKLEKIEDFVKYGVSIGLPSAIHSIGDRSTYEVIQILKKYPLKNGKKHRIEHLQLLDSEKSLNDMVKFNIVASIQPVHIDQDINFVNSLWGERVEKWGYLTKSLIDKNILTVMGSDSPVETPNPLKGIYCAINRGSFRSKDDKTVNYSEAIDLYNSLKCYTHNCSKLNYFKNVGNLEIGNRGDIAVLEKEINYDQKYLLNGKPYLTIVDGEIVYSKN